MVALLCGIQQLYVKGTPDPAIVGQGQRRQVLATEQSTGQACAALQAVIVSIVQGLGQVFASLSPMGQSTSAAS